MQSKAGQADWINLNGAQVRQVRQLAIVESLLAMDYHAMILTGHDIPENVDAIGLIANGFRRSRSTASSRAGTLAVGRRRGTGPASSHRAVLQILAGTFPFGPGRGRKNDSTTGPKELSDCRSSSAAISLV